MDKKNNPANISINEKYLQGIENFDIISIFGKDNLENIQKVISDVTGLAFITVDYKGDPVTQPTNFRNFCMKMRSQERYSSLCKLSDASGSIIAATTKQTSIYFCPCNFLEVAIPIVVNDRYLGGFIGGQVICHDAPDSVMRLNKNIVKAGNELQDIDAYCPSEKEDLKDIKVYSYSEFVSISNLVELIINQLTRQELISGHNKMKNLNRISELEAKVKDLEYKNNDLNIKYNELNRSMNVFFVRNIFNMMSNLSIIECANKTNDAILKYAKFIDSELQVGRRLTIFEELKRVEEFISINKIRYQDRLDYSIHVEKDLLNMKLPFSFMLPFVHFSIYYALTIKEEYKLEIRIYKSEKDINVIIEDDGFGLTPRELESKYELFGDNHEGSSILKSINEIRKSMVDYFGNDYKIVFECVKDIGTKTIIKYPIEFDEGL